MEINQIAKKRLIGASIEIHMDKRLGLSDQFQCSCLKEWNQAYDQ
ncbi:MAG: hypothetical protein ABH870_06775 [bacterium]